jgi:glycerophosphoryl diester phosphodiesterase
MIEGAHMTYLRKSWNLFSGNAKTAIIFEIIYKILLLIIVLPIEMGLINLAMMAKGYTYLTETNIVGFLTFPVTWIVLIVMIVFLAFYSLFEICALIALSHASRYDQRLRLRDVVIVAASRARRVMEKGNFGAIIFVLLLIPFTNVAMVSSAISDIHIPEFITEYISADLTLNLVYWAVFLVLCYVAFHLAFSLHYFLLENMTFRNSRKASKELVKGNIWYFLWRLLVWTLLLIFISSLLFLLIDNLSALVFSPGQEPRTLLLTTYVIDFAMNALVSCVTTPLAYAFLTEMFHSLLERKGRDIPPAIEIPIHQRKRIHKILAWLGGIALVAIALTLGTRSISTNTESLLKALSEGSSACAVSAHRGDSSKAPENTLEAFQTAIDGGADWVELDVQQTKDGVLVVMHDSNLKRTTGIDANIWDVNYDDIKNLDNGSWFSSEYSNVRICTLEQALQLCEGKIKMNIEVKPDGHGIDLEKKTVDLINAYDMAGQVGVASIKYDSLVKVKEYDPNITTIYDMLLAYGDISEIPDVDIYSVDEAFVTPALVSQVNGSDKLIYAWTVNDSDNIVRMYFYGVDSLVTDQIEEAENICR